MQLNATMRMHNEMLFPGKILRRCISAITVTVRRYGSGLYKFLTASGAVPGLKLIHRDTTVTFMHCLSGQD
jgi:hypothetical protein